MLDRDPEAARTRLRQRYPAWFRDGALPPEARPEIVFLPCDADTPDFDSPTLSSLSDGVHGWIVATGDDALNLRAGLALHRAMTMRRIDPAPVHVRIPTGHAEDAPALTDRPLVMARTFGSVDRVVARSDLMVAHPDALPRALHAAYEAAQHEMFGFAPSGWEALPETKRNSNRALFRHAVMKIEDFGAEAQAPLRGLPLVARGLQDDLRSVDAALDYMRVTAGSGPETWVLPGRSLDARQRDVARRLRAAAICEHNRWITERALDQFLPTAQPDAAQRDDTRRLHNNMFPWDALQDAMIRRYDVVMLRALFAHAGDTGLTARPRAAATLFLGLCSDGTARVTPLASGAAPGRHVTELRLHLPEPGNRNTTDVAGVLSEAVKKRLLVNEKDHPSRLRFDFSAPPSDALLDLANRLAETLRPSWPEQALIGAHWGWRRANGPVVAFAGHRDLTGFDETRLRDQLAQWVMETTLREGMPRLICGYAPGADRLMVAAWNDLGLPPPVLVFPFRQDGTDGNTIWLTDSPEQGGDETRVPAQALEQVGHPRLPGGAEGHAAQSAYLREHASVLLAALDPARPALPGGTGDTVARAEADGLRVVSFSP